MTQVAFELDLSSGQVRDVRATAEAGPLRDAFTWSVTCADGAVQVFALGHHGLEQIGRCTVDAAGVVRDRLGADDDEPNDYQWGRVIDGLGVALKQALTVEGPRRTDPSVRRRKGRAPGPAPARPAAEPRPAAPAVRSSRRTGVIVGVAAVAAVPVVFGVWGAVEYQGHRRRTPPPPPPPVAVPEDVAAVDEPDPPDAAVANALPTPEEAVLAAPSLVAAAAVVRDRLDERAVADGAWLLARYASGRATWADFHVADAETSLPLALKDGARERGKRLCVTGRLLDIARSDLDQRPVYAGALVTADGDTLRFIAVGSTGTLVKRDTGTFCGVVTGRVDDAAMAVGMFDLPENARPIVER
ncbi:MAG: hypothetical protein JNK64_18165 [Myxococcales bacterium]|nr:hypothetical protein [Myxococcales bacterium]